MSGITLNWVKKCSQEQDKWKDIIVEMLSSIKGYQTRNTNDAKNYSM